MGPSATVFLRTKAADDILDRLHVELATMATKVEATRKGRDWTLWLRADGEPDERPFYVHIWDTEARLWDCEDDLREFGLEASAMPAFVTITAGCNQWVDWQLARNLVGTLANRLDGVATRLAT